MLQAHLSAFPWFKLLWSRADNITARLGDVRVAPARIEQLLRQTGGVDEVEVSAATVRTGLLVLHDVRLTKHGQQLTGAGRLALGDLRAAVPMLQSLRPVSGPRGQLVLRGTASVLGVGAAVEVTVAARNGKLVLTPTGVLGVFGGITLYDDPRVHVESVGATSVPGGIRFVAHARLT